jgi:hypothetical protein
VSESSHRPPHPLSKYNPDIHPIVSLDFLFLLSHGNVKHKILRTFDPDTKYFLQQSPTAFLGSSIYQGSFINSAKNFSAEHQQGNCTVKSPAFGAWLKVEHLPSKRKALSSTPRTSKNKQTCSEVLESLECVHLRSSECEAQGEGGEGAAPRGSLQAKV